MLCILIVSNIDLFIPTIQRETGMHAVWVFVCECVCFYFPLIHALISLSIHCHMNECIHASSQHTHIHTHTLEETDRKDLMLRRKVEARNLRGQKKKRN